MLGGDSGDDGDGDQLVHVHLADHEVLDGVDDERGPQQDRPDEPEHVRVEIVRLPRGVDDGLVLEDPQAEKRAQNQHAAAQGEDHQETGPPGFVLDGVLQVVVGHLANSPRVQIAAARPVCGRPDG